MKKLSVLILIAFGLSVLLIGCGKAKRTGGTQGGALIIGITDEPPTLNPLFLSLTSSTGWEIADRLFLSLHRLDKNKTIQPLLAEGWRFSEDFMELTYYLRKDVKWSDGREVTASDVKYTFELMKDPKNRYAYAHNLDLIDKVEIINNYTVKFIFKQVYADELLDSGIPVLPKHVLELETKPLRESEFNKNPVTNGPFRFSKWLPGDRIELVANPDFFYGRPYLDKLIFKIFPNDASLISELQAGRVDIAPDVSPIFYEKLKEAKDLEIYTLPSNSYIFIAYNLKDPLFSDPEVRKAITYAINRDEILKKTLHGLGKLTCSPIPQSSWAYDNSISPYPFDISMAKEILKERGWKVIPISLSPRDRTKEDILSKDGKPFQFSLMTNRGNETREEIAKFVEKELKKLNIKVTLEIVDAGTFVQRISEGKYQAMILGWTTGIKVDPSPVWHTPTEGQKGRYNFVGYTNSEVDSLINEGLTKFDRRRAKEIWKLFQKKIFEDCPYTFLYVPERVMAIYKSLKGVETGGTTILSSVENWWVPKGDIRLVEDRVLVAVTTLPETTITPTPTPTPTPAPEITRTTTRPLNPEELLLARETRSTRTDTARTTKTESTPLTEEKKKEEVSTTTRPVETTKTTETPVEKPFIPPTDPELLSLPSPVYPEMARQAGIEGRVFVRVLVGTDGKVKDAKVVKGIGGGCDESALAAAKKATFKPGTKDGELAEAWITLPYSFKK